ncbi:MAG: AraC family transcriptional regulator [Mucilaginibacter sp.]|uniref:AraC family transcriptional regulator n=1 Tax=Mucilaginibacter sp. TaxID=1882438 RepID=UPI00326515F5
MKPQLLKVATGLAQSFSVRHDLIPFFNNKWHYHTEVELISLEKGTGTQFVGDNIRSFSDGDVVLIGANLPHYWRFDDHYFVEDSKSAADVIVAHFNENFWGVQFLLLPENAMIKNILDKAKRGIQIIGNTRARVAEMMQQMLKAESFKRMVILLEILELIAGSSEVHFLSSSSFLPNLEDAENERINAIYEYSLSNFTNKISLDEIATIACISPNSFCRYFKTHTGKTYSGFLLECKIGLSCKLLIQDKLSIQQICYESGFNNFASFHKYFKKLTGKTPLAYQKEFTHKKK